VIEKRFRVVPTGFANIVPLFTILLGPGKEKEFPPMRRTAYLAAALFIATAAPALAQDKCGPAPASPIIPDGKTATAEQVNAALTDVKAFIKASDDWQLCLKTDLDQQIDAAKGSKTPFDPKIQAAIVAKGDANQKEKVKVAQEYTASAHAYNQAHPKN
jgi:hypothetical protein